jgi:FkbM family methyltransferase
MMYNKNDAGIGRCLDLYGEWGDDGIFVLSQMLRPGDVVIDIGANLGTHTLAFARIVGESGVVIACEPQRIAYQMLCGNVALNTFPNVTCIAQAFSDVAEAVSVPAYDPNSPHDTDRTEQSETQLVELVDALPLDSLGIPKCALIRIGDEETAAKVIMGAKETLRRCRPILFVRNLNINLSRDILSAITSAEYQSYWQIANAYNPKNFFCNPENALAKKAPEANLVCIPKGTTLEGLIPVEGVEDTWQQAVRRSGRNSNSPASTG